MILFAVFVQTYLPLLKKTILDPQIPIFSWFSSSPQRCFLVHSFGKTKVAFPLPISWAEVHTILLTFLFIFIFKSTQGALSFHLELFCRVRRGVPVAQVSISYVQGVFLAPLITGLSASSSLVFLARQFLFPWKATGDVRLSQGTFPIPLQLFAAVSLRHGPRVGSLGAAPTPRGVRAARAPFPARTGVMPPLQGPPSCPSPRCIPVTRVNVSEEIFVVSPWQVLYSSCWNLPCTLCSCLLL